MAEESLTQRFQKASRKEHRLSDGLVAARLVLTATDKRRWADALTSFWYIYAAVEGSLQNCRALPECQAFFELLPSVRRTESFEADLEAFYGPRWRDKVRPPSPAVQTYLERVAGVQRDKPHLLLAHAYTQHMAMLAGGQILRRSVRSSLQLGPDDPGTAIFETKEAAKALRVRYKQVVDDLEGPLGEERARELVDEHRLVFKLNNDVIRSFPVTPGSALRGIGRLLPPEVMLLAISVTLALALMLYTRRWIVVDPDADDFRDPDAVIS